MASDYDGSAARGKAFQSFYDRTGRKSFSPEFITSIVQTLQIAEGVCLTERVWAWVRWRTWGNSSETAMSSWHSSGWELDQVDCALDLYWFENGKSLDDVANATREERAAARRLPGVTSRKMPISRAFAKLKARAQVDTSRGRIYALVTPQDSPQVVENRLIVPGACYYNFSDPAFQAWLQVTDTRYYEECRDVETSYLKMKRGKRARYREWLKQLPPAAASLYGLKVDKEVKEYSGGGVVRSAVEEPPPPPDPPPPTPEQETGMVVQGYLARMNPGKDIQWPDDHILRTIHRLRIRARKSIEELIGVLDELWRAGRKPRSYAFFVQVLKFEWELEE